MSEVWLTTDPRHSINKWARIVILRPNLKGQLEACMGHVDTKEVWCIWTEFENRKKFSADDKWEDGWFWTWAP